MICGFIAMNGPSARALREGGTAGSLKYKLGTTISVKFMNDGPLPQAVKRKMPIQEAFGDYGQVVQIDINEGQKSATVEYDDARDAQDAAQCMDGKHICGCKVQVDVVTMTSRSSGLQRGTIEGRASALASKYGLDAPSEARLVGAFEDRARRGCDLEKDFEELSEHLAASNKPSALICMKLADLRAGKAIGKCEFRGTRRKQESILPVQRIEGSRRSRSRDRSSRRSRERSQKERSRRRSRTRSRSRDRHHSHQDGSKRRSQDRSRKASRSRSRDRKRSH